METTTTNQTKDTRGEKRPLSLATVGSQCIKRVSFTPSLKRTKLEAHCGQQVGETSEQKKLKALTDANELAKKRFASRESSRRTRERERHKMDHFQNNKAKLEQENERIREENERIRKLIEAIRKSGATCPDAKAAMSNHHVSPTSVKPQISAPTTDPMSLLSQLVAATPAVANDQNQVPTSTSNMNQAAIPSSLQPALQQVVLQFLSNALMPTRSQAAMPQPNALQSQLLAVVTQCLRAAGGTKNDLQTMPPPSSLSNQPPTNWSLPPPMISPSQQQSPPALPSLNQQQQQEQQNRLLIQQILLLQQQQQGNQQLPFNVGHSTS